MNVIQSSPFNNATTYIPYSLSRPQSIPRRQIFRVTSCKATKYYDFRKELSALNPKCANADQMKKAYRKLVLRCHPDVCDPSMKEQSTRMFIELQNAYKKLLDQEYHGKAISSELGASRDKWESQILELKRQSQWRQEQNQGSWGCRMRSKLHYP